MNELIQYITNNGVAIVLLVYFIVNNNKSLISLKDAILELTHSNTELKNLMQSFIDLSSPTRVNLNKE